MAIRFAYRTHIYNGKKEKHKMSNKSWKRLHYACCTVSQIHNRFTDNLNAKKGGEETIPLQVLRWQSTRTLCPGSLGAGCDVGEVQPLIQSVTLMLDPGSRRSTSIPRNDAPQDDGAATPMPGTERACDVWQRRCRDGAAATPTPGRSGRAT